MWSLPSLESQPAPDREALGQPDSMVLVIPRLKKENTTWLDDLPHPVSTAIYVADDLSAPLHPPKNKGNEAMIYLTYIIDHYDTLPAVILFLHNHRTAWHNNDLLNHDIAESLRRLNYHRLARSHGYMNLRCHWDPGCPAWLHPGATAEVPDRKEELFIARAFSELFPLTDIPQTLAQPCCSQMAVTREVIQRTPRGRWIFFRDWLLRTSIRDSMSGRIWEYLWQVVFAGESEVCPAMHACYCDGYGVCFEDDEEFGRWFEVRWRMQGLERELAGWFRENREVWEGGMNGAVTRWEDLEFPAESRERWLKDEVGRLRNELGSGRRVALERGMDPRIRAEVSGREYKAGDGF
ncbi:hypothetical protein P152DRAFT_464357 [Eremomyces bilateralis CBS 781.70]|uniref:Uncharacterized protein n=1 Tax=Eremomyces bilateralis CBS 781.70 TaxID=1392243 RepID=A0A6G1GBR1_9PEZI|nr:uncharacterized protein P152DRAFT_464357 [Eremomyces bilateralis CBS 781.70]KAF1815527.1 hypothetical protein P152DRAFT_464357 [Eremomyces bilateralis CBS 781.70]